jgi:hypothetical protein
MSPFAAAAECGYAILSRREVIARRHHECSECGLSIERSEAALRTVIIEGHCVRSEYLCCAHPWHRRITYH